MCVDGSGRKATWKASCAVAVLQNFYPPKGIKVNWVTWQLSAAVNLNRVSVFFSSCNGGVGFIYLFIFKILASLIGTEFVTLAVTTSEKNVWRKESMKYSQKSQCVYWKQLNRSFIQNQNISFVWQFTKIYEVLPRFSVFIIINNARVLYWNSKFLATGHFGL